MDATTKTVRVPQLEVDFEVLAGDEIIGPAIERGMWEAHETRLFRAHLEPGARVLDLGANVGWFTVHAILAGCEVHAFEPVPAIADVLERNVERALRAGRGSARVHRCAAGAERGSATIALGRTNFGDNRVLDAGRERPGDMGAGDTIEIAIERVDALVEGPCRVIKIDTQGSEWLAIQGARELFAKSRETALLLELWPYALRGAQARELLEWLVREGFTTGKATAAPYPMSAERLLKQALARDPVKGGLDLYAVRGLPFHVGGLETRARSLWRSLKEL